MAFLREVLRAGCALLIVALSAVVAWKLVRAGLRRGGWRGLWDRFARGGPLDGQMGLISVAVALLALVRSLRAAGSGALPPVPPLALAVVGISNLVWLGSLVRRRLRRADHGLN